MIAMAVPLVTILLCTFNGESHLQEQLDSIETQTHRNWRLIVSDDGSCDDTLALLRRFSGKFSDGRVLLRKGPRKGSTLNFLELTRSIDIPSDYYAFCDQDDIWLADKLGRALSWLEKHPRKTTTLYCGRTRLIDERGNFIGDSPLFLHPPCFGNSLVQSIAGGNTMVFNASARDLISRWHKPHIPVAHDWWVYLAVAACGGSIHYDPKPCLLYRQHANNLVGANNSPLARARRIRWLFQGRFQQWIDANILALDSLAQFITPENRNILNMFSDARQQASAFQRIASISNADIFRQTRQDQVALLLAAFFKKL